jgi:hypothetical protein
VFGAVPDAHVAHLESALSDDYACVEATGVWRALHLRSKEQCEQYCTQRQQQLAGAPHWHSEAITADGRMLFVHFQNVLTHKQHKTLIGLSSGILVHMFDDDQRIQRWVEPGLRGNSDSSSKCSSNCRVRWHSDRCRMLEAALHLLEAFMAHFPAWRNCSIRVWLSPQYDVSSCAVQHSTAGHLSLTAAAAALIVASMEDIIAVLYCALPAVSRSRVPHVCLPATCDLPCWPVVVLVFLMGCAAAAVGCCVGR